MPTSIATTTDIRVAMPAVKVFTKRLWRDAWTERTGLWCKSAEFACSPTVGEAVLEWRYGHGCPPGDDFGGLRVEIDRLDVEGHYVKIVVDPDPDDAGQPDADGPANAIPVWCGRIVEIHDSRYGVVPAAEKGETVETGVQTLVCWSLEYELDRNPLCRSVVAGVVGSAEESVVQRVLGFNCQTGGRGLGDALQANRSDAPGLLGSYVFAAEVPLIDDSTTIVEAPFWRLSDIAEYLIAYFGPGAEIDDDTPSYWRIDAAVEMPALKPKLNAEGMTLKQCLDHLFDRRRGLGWYATVIPDALGDDQPWIVPFTHTDEDIVLESGETIPANPNQVELDFDSSLDIQQAQVRQSEVARYDQVRVRGGRLGAVFTLRRTADIGFSDQIVGDWSAADEQAYHDAASLAADYPADPEDRQRRNAAARTGLVPDAGSRVQHVYARFKLADDWDGKDHLGTNALCWTRLNYWYEPPTANRQQDVVYQAGSNLAVTWRPGLRFERYLPLHAGVDYSAPGDYPEMIAEGSGSDHDFLPPLVLIALPAALLADATQRYVRVDDVSALAQIEHGDSPGLTFACSVAVRDDDAGFTLRVGGGGGAPQHLLAAADFTALGLEHGDEFDATYACDWKTIYATVYVLLDQYAEAVSPADDDLRGVALETRRVLTINVPDAHLDYIVPGTVIGLKDGVGTSSTGGVIRSDLPRLQAMAQAAAAWYCRERKMLTLQYRQVRRTVDLGQLVTEIGSAGHEEDILTAVTRIRYDLEAGTTTVQTAHAELDCRQM